MHHSGQASPGATRSRTCSPDICANCKPLQRRSAAPAGLRRLHKENAMAHHVGVAHNKWVPQLPRGRRTRAMRLPRRTLSHRALCRGSCSGIMIVYTMFSMCPTLECGKSKCTARWQKKPLSTDTVDLLVSAEVVETCMQGESSATQHSRALTRDTPKRGLRALLCSRYTQAIHVTYIASASRMQLQRRQQQQMVECCCCWCNSCTLRFDLSLLVGLKRVASPSTPFQSFPDADMLGCATGSTGQPKSPPLTIPIRYRRQWQGLQATNNDTITTAATTMAKKPRATAGVMTDQRSWGRASATALPMRCTASTTASPVLRSNRGVMASRKW